MSVGAGLRLVAACRSGALLGYRPTSPAAHVVPTGHPTRSGAWVRTSSLPLCGQRTRRLRVGGMPLQVVNTGRRFCRRCTNRLPWSLGRVSGGHMYRHDIRAAYGHLTLDDLRLAAAWTVTVEDTHLVARVAQELFGRAPLVRPDDPASPRGQLYEFDGFLLRRRRRLAEAELTDEARADRDAAVEQRLYERSLVAAKQRRDTATEIALERERTGQYLTSRQQYLVDHAI